MDTTRAQFKAKIIDRQPSDRDAFSAGGHDRSADALVDTIIQLADRDGAIGLEGDWGSGKSTVVEIAEGKLAAADVTHTYKLFKFDLWAHQADDFRRAFLEEFVSWIGSEKLLDTDALTAVKDKIRNRKRRVSTKHKNKYSVAGLITFASLPLLPIVYSWLDFSSIAVRDAINNQLEIYFTPFQWTAIFLIFALYILVTVATIVNIYSQKETDFDDDVSNSGLLAAFSKTIDLFQRKSDEDTVTQNIRENDPTTLEFYNIFRRELLSPLQRNAQRVVIIFDNIDRLPADRVALIWSEVRSVFSNAPTTDALAHSWVTAVVAYDRRVVESTLGRSGEDQNDTTMAAQLVSKTFDRVIRVSPPVGTDWKAYLYGKFHEAIAPALNEGQLFRIYKLLDVYLILKKERATPRHIVSFVNDFGALWVQWRDSLQPESLALWVLTRTTYEKTPNALLDPALMDRRYTAVANVTNWQLELAALAFNVPKERAEEVLFKQPLRVALVDPDPSELRSLSVNDAFPAKLEEVLHENADQWAADNSEEFAVVVRNLHLLSLSKSVAQMVWSQMSKALNNIGQLELTDTDQISDLALVISNQDSSKSALDLAHRLFNCVASLTFTGNDWKQDIIRAKHWVTSIATIRSAVSEVDQVAANSFITLLNIPDGGRAHVAIAASCDSVEGIEYSEFPGSPPSNFDQNLETLLPEDKRAFRGALRGILEASSTIPEANIKAVATSLSNALREPSSSTPDVSIVVECLVMLWVKSKSACASVVSPLGQDGTLQYWAHKAVGDEEDLACANLLYLLVESVDKPVNVAAPNVHPKLGNIADAINWYNSVAQGNETIAGSVIDNIVETVEKGDSFPLWFNLTAEFGNK